MVRPQGALQVNTTGQANFAGGVSALQNNVTGSFNTALGYAGGYNLNGSESYDIDIGNYGVSGESGAIRIGTAGTQIATYLVGPIYTAGPIRSTNGFASFSTVTNSYTTTGMTNTNAVDLDCYGVTGTSVSLSNAQSASVTSLGTITTGTYFHLHPGWALEAAGSFTCATNNGH